MSPVSRAYLSGQTGTWPSQKSPLIHLLPIGEVVKMIMKYIIYTHPISTICDSPITGIVKEL